MPVRVITPPAAEPVTLAEAKAYARVDISADDSLISAMIVAAREAGERETRRAFMPQTLELTLDAFPRRYCPGRPLSSAYRADGYGRYVPRFDKVELPRPPLAAVTSVSYLDPTTGVLTVLNSSTYVLVQESDDVPVFLVPVFGTDWPAVQLMPAAVRIRYTAGWPDAASVPEEIKAWIKTKVSTFYENREEFIADVRAAALEYPNRFVDRLLDAWRIVECV